MKTTRQHLIEALRRGEAVIASHFAGVAGVSRQAVHMELVKLERAGAVVRRRDGVRGEWALASPEALPAVAERTVVEKPQRETGNAAAELLAFFGIRLAHIQLPARRHFRSDEVPA
ncbi:helix-turn-helix domain-containing protein [Cupriavidus sp. BIC8F]|uniref:helix-turn-helix domain-containing protein n=1 Tax=Cupriavidus sp. BIC8F TaxID=3079014 RepID=UPI002917090D|nr:helix-turn-helix domain-containing protein [Cupriavidus sp. BIC8F]